MTTEIVNSERFAELQGWADEVSEYRKQKYSYSARGYHLFFDVVTKLPIIESQHAKHWTDLLEEEIEFVDIDRKENPLTLEDRRLMNRAEDILGIREPLRIGIFDIEEKRHLGKEHSARVVVESKYGDIFRQRVVIHLGCAFLDTGELAKARLGYTTYGFDGEDYDRIRKASKLDMLLAANCLAQLYTKRVDTNTTQPAS